MNSEYVPGKALSNVRPTSPWDDHKELMYRHSCLAILLSCHACCVRHLALLTSVQHFFSVIVLSLGRAVIALCCVSSVLSSDPLWCCAQYCVPPHMRNRSFSIPPRIWICHTFHSFLCYGASSGFCQGSPFSMCLHIVCV